MASKDYSITSNSNESRCILHIFPAEVREAIFLEVIQDVRSGNPKRYTHILSFNEAMKPTFKATCGHYEYRGHVCPTNITPLEHALIGDKTLYGEIVAARTKTSMLGLTRPAQKSKSTPPLAYPDLRLISPVCRTSIRRLGIEMSRQSLKRYSLDSNKPAARFAGIPSIWLCKNIHLLPSLTHLQIKLVPEMGFGSRIIHIPGPIMGGTDCIVSSTLLPEIGKIIKKFNELKFLLIEDKRRNTTENFMFSAPGSENWGSENLGSFGEAMDKSLMQKGEIRVHKGPVKNSFRPHESVRCMAVTVSWKANTGGKLVWVDDGEDKMA